MALSQQRGFLGSSSVEQLMLFAPRHGQPAQQGVSRMIDRAVELRAEAGKCRELASASFVPSSIALLLKKRLTAKRPPIALT